LENRKSETQLNKIYRNKSAITGAFIALTFIMFFFMLNSMVKNYKQINMESISGSNQEEKHLSDDKASNGNIEPKNLTSGEGGQEQTQIEVPSGNNNKDSKENSKPDSKETSPTTAPYDSKDSKEKNVHYIPIGIEKAKGEEILIATKNYFETRIPYLSKSLSESPFYFTERLLDESTGTSVYILAKNSNYASNLNGYFYYLFDKSNSSLAISPLVLNISALFEEEDRKIVFENKSYAGDEQKQALQKSLTAILGELYTDEVFEFVYGGYKETFNRRITGKSTDATINKLVYKELEVIFHDSFITYVEFYVKRTG